MRISDWSSDVCSSDLFVGEDGGFSLENYRRMIDSSSYLEIFRITFEVSAITTAISILIGYPLAYFMSQLPNRVANLSMITVMVPLWPSVLVRTYAWLVLLKRRGLLNGWGISLGLWKVRNRE